MFIANAMIELEITKMEEEIKQRELELMQSIEQTMTTPVGHIPATPAHDKIIDHSTVLQDNRSQSEENLYDPSEQIIPPPPMFSSARTPEPPEFKRELNRVKTSTAIVHVSTCETSQPYLHARDSSYVENKNKFSEEFSYQSTVLQCDYSVNKEDLGELSVQIIPPPPVFSDLSWSALPERKQEIFGFPVTIVTNSAQEPRAQEEKMGHFPPQGTQPIVDYRQYQHNKPQTKEIQLHVQEPKGYQATGNP